MPAEAVIATLRQAWDILSEFKVRAAVIGGLALAHWGHIRATQDADLLIAHEAHPHALLARFAAIGFRSKGRDPIVRLLDAESIQLFFEPRNMFVEVRLDLLLAQSDLQKDALERRVWPPANDLGFEIAVLSCEDLIVFKLLAGRIIDRFDAAGLLEANRDTLDWAYLKSSVMKLGLDQGLRDAWKDAFGDERPPI